MSTRTTILVAAYIALAFTALAAPTWAQVETADPAETPPPLQRPSMAPT